MAHVDEIVTRGDTISARLDFSASRSERVRRLARPRSARAAGRGRRSRSSAAAAINSSTTRPCQITSSPAYAWRTLGLVEADGTPTRRGIIFSILPGGEGLAIAAALEDERYPIDDLVFDLANIRGGPRFAGEDAPMGGRLGILCQRVYERADYPGYLEMGVPAHYGSGASEVIREVVANPGSRTIA